MSNKVVVVTGANKGIGFCVVKQILQQHPNWTVYLTGRDLGRVEDAVKKLKDECSFEARGHELDIDCLDSIRAFRDFIKAEHPSGIDVLINNAAILPSVKADDSTETEFKFNKSNSDLTIKTDYFSVLNVCTELFPLLANDARVVIVSSFLAQVAFSRMTDILQQMIRMCSDVEQVNGVMNGFLTTDLSKLEYNGWLACSPNEVITGPFSVGLVFPYGLAKLGLNLLTTILQRQVDAQGKRIAVNCCCPGLVKTDMNPYGHKTPDEGADTIVYLALLPPGTQQRGRYFTERTEHDLFLPPAN